MRSRYITTVPDASTYLSSWGQPVEPAYVFPQFTLLPAELRIKIWMFALPQRLLPYTLYPSAQSYLPVPHIARVCREARDVVMSRGIRVWRLSLRQRRPHPDTVIHRAQGFFMRGVDCIYVPYPHFFFSNLPSALPSTNNQPEMAKAKDGVWEARLGWRGFVRLLGEPAFGVSAPQPHSFHHRLHLTEPVTVLWPLTGLVPNKAREALVVIRYATLECSWEHTRKTLSKQEVERIHGSFLTRSHILVDLEDRELLADLAAVHGAGLGVGWWPCLPCLKSQWQKEIRPYVLQMWLYGGEILSPPTTFLFPPTISYSHPQAAKCGDLPLPNRCHQNGLHLGEKWYFCDAGDFEP